MTSQQDKIERLMKMMERTPGYKVHKAVLDTVFEWTVNADTLVTSKPFDTSSGPVTVNATIRRRDECFQSVMRATRLPVVQEQT